MKRQRQWKSFKIVPKAPQNLPMWASKQLILIPLSKSLVNFKLLSTCSCLCQTHYDILDVPRSATQKEIRAAYLKKSREVWKTLQKDKPELQKNCFSASSRHQENSKWKWDGRGNQSKIRSSQRSLRNFGEKTEPARIRLGSWKRNTRIHTEKICRQSKLRRFKSNESWRTCCSHGVSCGPEF